MNLNIGDFVVDTWLIVVLIIAAVIFLAIAVIWGIRAHRFRISAGVEEMIGREARVVTVLNPKGTVFLEGEQWTAISENGRIEPEEEVVITRVDGLKLYVKKQ